MSARVNYFQLSGDLAGNLLKITNGLKASSLEADLVDLVNLRVSQINGCTFCLDMHVKEAKLRGERELRLYHLVTWRESSLFSQRERLALEWTEELTELPAEAMSDMLYDRMRVVFSEKEISDLTFAVGAINFWNRLAISFKSVPGSSDKMFGLDKAGLH